ncbi:arginine N-succinyltransferase [Gilvimarinus sp. F26214L]|uniref:arginine N-succinyltransferase n=1 Tax=Gilvimarinus sp. DZF01 TaxID=3461371 RepID=UPI00404642E6
MWLVRPALPDDLDQILHIVRARGRGLSSTLPRDADALARRIELSGRSFSDTVPQGQAGRFLFVLDDTDLGKVRGVSAIDARAGNGQPFYNYRRDSLIHASHELHISRRVEMLYPAHAITDRTLLCGFAIEKELAGSAAFELLSRARILFMAGHRSRFAENSVVEIQGLQNEDGSVPFWDSLGRHFFNMDFETADHYSTVLSKTFIAELMPPNPIYVTLLTEAAQAAVGQAHSAARAACDVLRREGFETGCYVDIFDAGPVLEAQTDALFSVQNSHPLAAHEASSVDGPVRLLACGEGPDFRCTLGPIQQVEDRAYLGDNTRRILGCEDGGVVRSAETFEGGDPLC